MLLRRFQRRGLSVQSTYLRRRRRHRSQGLGFKMQTLCLQLTVSWRKARLRPKPLRPQSIPLVLWPLLPVPHQIQAWQFLSLFFHCLDSIATPPCQIFCLNLPGHIEPLPFKFPFIWGSATADPDVPKGPSGCSYGHAAAGWHVKHTQVWDIPGSTKRWFQEKGT